MTTLWAHLPNAFWVDKIIKDLEDPAKLKKLSAAWDATRHATRHAAWDAAWGAAWDAAQVAVRSAAWNATRHAAWDAARDAARDAVRGAALDAAWGAVGDAVGDAILALTAYDDCAHWLSADVPVEAMRVAHLLSSHPATLLLLPYKNYLAGVQNDTQSRDRTQADPRPCRAAD